MKVEGIIDSITSKTVSNGGTVFNAVIDGQDVNLGFECNYTEGEYASIEVESTKWGLQVPKKGGKKSFAGSTPKSGATPRPTAPAQPKQMFPVDANTKDHSIIRQNALTNANTAVSNACVSSKEGGFKTREEYYNEVIKVAYNLSGFAMGTLDKALVEQAKAQQAAGMAAEAEGE